MNLEAEKLVEKAMKQMKKNRPKSVKKKPPYTKVKKIGMWTITGPANKDELLRSQAYSDKEATEEQKVYHRNTAFVLEVLSLSKIEIKMIKSLMEKDYSVLYKLHEGNSFLNKRNQKMFNDGILYDLTYPRDTFSKEVLDSLKSA
jgi:hypothetical protein